MKPRVVKACVGKTHCVSFTTTAIDCTENGVRLGIFTQLMRFDWVSTSKDLRVAACALAIASDGSYNICAVRYGRRSQCEFASMWLLGCRTPAICTTRFGSWSKSWMLGRHQSAPRPFATAFASLEQRVAAVIVAQPFTLFIAARKTGCTPIDVAQCWTPRWRKP